MRFFVVDSVMFRIDVEFLWFTCFHASMKISMATQFSGYNEIKKGFIHVLLKALLKASAKDHNACCASSGWRVFIHIHLRVSMHGSVRIISLVNPFLCHDEFATINSSTLITHTFTHFFMSYLVLTLTWKRVPCWQNVKKMKASLRIKSQAFILSRWNHFINQWFKKNNFSGEDFSNLTYKTTKVLSLINHPFKFCIFSFRLTIFFLKIFYLSTLSPSYSYRQPGEGNLLKLYANFLLHLRTLHTHERWRWRRTNNSNNNKQCNTSHEKLSSYLQQGNDYAKILPSRRFLFSSICWNLVIGKMSA